MRVESLWNDKDERNAGSSRKEIRPIAIRPQRVPHGIACDWIRGYAVKDLRLNTWGLLPAGHCRRGGGGNSSMCQDGVWKRRRYKFGDKEREDIHFVTKKCKKFVPFLNGSRGHFRRLQTYSDLLTPPPQTPKMKATSLPLTCLLTSGTLQMQYHSFDVLRGLQYVLLKVRAQKSMT